MPCTRATGPLTLTLFTRMVARDTGDLERVHLGPGFLEPQPHAHFVEQAHRRREMLRPIAYSPAELAEAEAAVSDERAHAKLRGQSRRGGVVRFGRRHVQAVAM